MSISRARVWSVLDRIYYTVFMWPVSKQWRTSGGSDQNDRQPEGGAHSDDQNDRQPEGEPQVDDQNDRQPERTGQSQPPKVLR